MRKVLWVCNIMLPVIGQELNLPYSNREGWLSGIFERAGKEEAPFKLGICFPLAQGAINRIKGEPLCKGRIGGQIKRKETVWVKRFAVQKVICYAFAENLSTPDRYDARMPEEFKRILEDFAPDILHVFGTEFPHSLAAVHTYAQPAKTLVGIQGLCSEIAKVYMAGLPEEVQEDVTFRDYVRKDSIRQQQKKFARRGEYETGAIWECGNITGRTRFDREKTAVINPSAQYYQMNETMRKEFYTGKWSLKDCQEHSIFLGQGDYPLKGMHFVLEAMSLLRPGYPDLKLYVAGNNILGRGRLKRSAYGKYLLALIKKYGLESHVVSVGKLSAEEMKRQFLKSSVYVCPSALENSPNTVGEAQLLGVPLVASMAGGIPDMVKDGKDGLLFPTGDVKKLAKQIEALWDRNTDGNGLCLAERISEGGRRRARMVHDGENNYLRLLEIYDAIGSNACGKEN